MSILPWGTYSPSLLEGRRGDAGESGAQVWGASQTSSGRALRSLHHCWVRTPLVRGQGDVHPLCCCSVSTSWTAGFPVLHHLLEPAQPHVHQAGDAVQPSHPLSSPSPAFNFSQHQGLFQWAAQVAKYWNFSFSISLSSEYSELISFRMGWFDLLIVQGTLKSLLQHHSLKTSIFWCSGLLYGPPLTFVHDCWLWP